MKCDYNSCTIKVCISQRNSSEKKKGGGGIYLNMAAPINVIKQGVVVVCFLTLLLSWQQDIFLSVTDICEGFQSKNIELSTRGLLWSSFDVTSWKQYSCVILEQGSRNKSVEYRLLSP